MGRSTEHYRKNAKSRKKKNAAQKKINATPKEKARIKKQGRLRYAAKKAGKNVKGKDVSHTKNGVVLKSSSKNRGSKSDRPGDKRARGTGAKKARGKKRR